MTSVFEHYEGHLAPLYSWICGGMDHALSRGRDELAELGLATGDSRYAVDLGAGFGMHAIPLAQFGWKVLAIDSSANLLDELKAHPDSGSVAAARDDLLSFPRHLSRKPDAVLCMGDTLAHLPDRGSVQELIRVVAEHLAPGGRFVMTFRDYSKPPDDTTQFVPVRSDPSRIFVCCLEYRQGFVNVHDILHERDADAWSTRVSSYRKLRLQPGWVKQQLEQGGFSVDVGPGLSGMIRLDAVRDR
jgi:SAM-dependent methyltransferase